MLSGKPSSIAGPVSHAVIAGAVPVSIRDHLYGPFDTYKEDIVIKAAFDKQTDPRKPISASFHFPRRLTAEDIKR